jgi:acetolactate synthase-1/2/3 large subunit
MLLDMVKLGADIIIKSLEENSVKHVFSHPGGPLLPIYDSLRKSSIVHNVLVRHEGAGSFIAEAYAKTSGRIGVCMSTMGPGAENMMIGVGTARSDSVPLLAMTGQLSTSVLGKGYQQETDHVSIFRPITKWSTQVLQTGMLASTMRRAFYLAYEGRPGPVHVDLPRDIQVGEVDALGDLSPISLSHTAPPSDSIAKVVSLLMQSKRPVLLVGGGVITANASDELTKTAHLLCIPVVTSYNGRGAISEDMDESLGRAGEYTIPIPNRVLREADLIIVLGYRFTDVSTEGWRPAKEACIVQVDIDPKELGKNQKIDLPIHSDIKLFLELLLSHIETQAGIEKLRREDWMTKCAQALSEWKTNYQTIMLSKSKPIKPQRVIQEINKRLPNDAIVVAGAGRSKMWAATLIPIRRARSWIHSGGYAVMGYSLCGAIGAKFAAPNRPVFAVDGDGAFQMHCQEIATARENNLSFVVCVLNDMSLGAIRSTQIRSYGRRIFGTEFKLDTNTANVAASFGGDGERVEDPEALGPALDKALSSKVPYVLDIVIDKEEEPLFQ